jgi:hypothetical protein
MTPKVLDLTHLARRRKELLEWNDMHKFKGLMTKIRLAKDGERNMANRF